MHFMISISRRLSQRELSHFNRVAASSIESNIESQGKIASLHKLLKVFHYECVKDCHSLSHTKINTNSDNLDIPHVFLNHHTVNHK